MTSSWHICYASGLLPTFRGRKEAHTFSLVGSDVGVDPRSWQITTVARSTQLECKQVSDLLTQILY